MTILIVDDEPEYRMLIRDVLMQDGINVFTAENGSHALRRLGEIQVDMIISDVYMPVMDGVRLHKAVRKIPQFEKVPFLFVSGYDDEYTLNSVKDPRYDGFLRKGRPIGELKEWVKYLTTPESSRGKFMPGQSARPM